MRKHFLIASIITVALIATGCDFNFSSSFSGPTVEKSSVKTVNGSTQGSAEKRSAGKGDARFNIDGGHVEMTNVSFDSINDLKINAKIDDNNNILYTISSVYDDDDFAYIVLDGNYREDFKSDKIVTQLNDLLSVIPVSDGSVLSTSLEHIEYDGHVFKTVFKMEEDETMIIACAAENASKWFMICVSSEGCEKMQISSDDIVSLIKNCHKQIGGVELNSGRVMSDVLTAGSAADLTTADNTVGKPDNDIPAETNAETVNNGTEADQIQSGTNVHAEIEPANSTGSYSIVIGGASIEGIAIPESWQPYVSDGLIIMYPEDGLTVQYSDSFIKKDDTNAIQDTVDTTEKVYESAVRYETTELNGEMAHILYWENDGYNNAEIYQAIPGGKTYLVTRISDYNKIKSMDEMMEYVLNVH